MSDKNIFYVEITDLHQSWIAAVCETKETIEHFIKHLPLKIKSSAQIKMLDGKSYPVYAIESYKGDRNSFKLVDQEELFELIRNQKEYTVAHEDHIYFTFYTFETDYFQHPTEKSLMGALNHTHVNNEYLQEETITKSEYHSEICSLSDKYDIDGLDKLYKVILISDNKMAKYDLAHYGYLSILWNLLYDYACNKLPESGLGLLPDLVENSELLLEKKNWQARVQVEFVLLENACKKPTKEIITFLRQLIESLHHLLEQSPEETEEVYQKQALAYAMVANTLPSQHSEFWEKAILALQNGIHKNAETADWSLYARLVFMPAPEINSYKSSGKKLGSIIQNYQKLEQENFKNLLNKHTNYNEKMPYLIALNLHQLKEHMEWEKVNLAYFPEQLYFYWLDQAIQSKLPPLNRIDLNEACHFFIQKVLGLAE
ncbi:hypothetical protein GCM10011506_35060 [Marivirga lumbricoides]|uniref:Uncharacterized protein n=1 Tax=Marivirga lumbricoides TaxID=1046115 RepID=A0ABQ1MTW3_9BACT|nr:hypothetical protein GCM10011506_35060 [Marivirga lumbricoides]